MDFTEPLKEMLGFIWDSYSSHLVSKSISMPSCVSYVTVVSVLPLALVMKLTGDKIWGKACKLLTSVPMYHTANIQCFISLDTSVKQGQHPTIFHSSDCPPRASRVNYHSVSDHTLLIQWLAQHSNWSLSLDALIRSGDISMDIWTQGFQIFQMSVPILHDATGKIRSQAALRKNKIDMYSSLKALDTESSWYLSSTFPTVPGADCLPVVRVYNQHIFMFSPLLGWVAILVQKIPPLQGITEAYMSLILMTWAQTVGKISHRKDTA